jgi:hypothetical protein
MAFSADNIRRRVREQPFQPLRLVLMTGETYDLRHPDQIAVFARYLVLALPGPAGGVPEEGTRVALSAIAEVRDLAAAVSATGNGEA